MGVVYRAQDPAIGRIIAIKTIRLNDLSDTVERDRLRERLFREAQSAGMLSHPNIVTIYDIAEENAQACIFMEFVNGPSLETLLNTHEPADKQTFLDIFRQTAAALDYAHRRGIVHRDIKPANIMIHDDGQAKITDFGVAKVISHQMTHSGNMMGTPNYMSPEQVQGFKVDGRADQFSLAVIAYELLTGEKPFSGEYLPTLLYKIVREAPVAPTRLNPTLSPQIEDVLNRGLAKEPENRFANCSDFVASLTEACKATPNWAPLPRGASHTLPTDHGLPPLREQPKPAAPLAVPPRPIRPDDTIAARQAERNPLMRSLVWMLAGIGLVGLVLLGAQKFLLNPPLGVSQETASTAAPPEVPQPAPQVEKPSPTGAVLPGEKNADPEPPPVERPKPVKPVTASEPGPDTKQDEPKPSAEREVQLLTEPAGATIIVDGSATHSCKTPCLLQLTPGRHTLTTQLDGYRPYPHIFQVPQDSDIFLPLNKSSGTLSVISTPSGASIMIDGELRPQKTPAIFQLAPGEYAVRVSYNGVPLDFKVQVKEGEFHTRSVNFQ